jgi:putative nucleotidyltransferase with HDIG domain
MGQEKGRTNRGRLRMFIVPVVLSTLVSVALYVGAFESLEMITLDLRLGAISGGEAAPIAFAAIDQNTLKALGQWPLPRGIYPRAMNNILEDGALAVLVDIDFSSRGPDPDQDRQLIEYVSRAGKIVLAAQVEENVLPEGAVLRNLSLPLPELAAGALTLGSITFEIDPDGSVRRMPGPIDFIDTAYPPLGLAGAELFRAGAGKNIPDDALISFSAKNLGSFPVVSFNNIVTGRFVPGTFTDRIVFIGATSPDLHDFWSTPIGVIPGMFIQAAVMETGLNRSWSTRQGVWSSILTVFAVSLLISLLVSRANWRRGALYLLGYLFLLIVMSGAMSWLHFMIQFTPLFILGVVQYPAQVALSLRRVEKSLDLEKRKTDTILKFSEMQDMEELGNDSYLAPLVLLKQVMGLGRITLYILDEHAISGWRIEKVTSDEPGSWEFRRDIVTEAVETGQMVFDRDSEPGALSLYVPMMTTRGAVGVLCAMTTPGFGDDENDLRLLLSYVTQTSYYIETRQLASKVKLLYSSTLSAISKALDTKDYFTGAHAELSLEFIGKFGLACRLNSMEVEVLHVGTLLHDIGKIGVPDAILTKTGVLTSEEFESLKGHPAMGYEIIKDLPFPEDVKMIVRHHHEQYDGNGYPDGLKGEEIPRLVRIFSIMDTYEALTGKRPYRSSSSPEAARALLQKSAGTQFDPRLVELFLSIF